VAESLAGTRPAPAPEVAMTSVAQHPVAGPALAGEVDQARATFQRAAAYANDVGLLAEEVDRRGLGVVLTGG
jgi:hypothetical protein